MRPAFTIHVPYVNGDELIHTEANHYRCQDETCPCQPALWTGALMAIDRNITEKQQAAHGQGEPTAELPKWRGPIPDVGQGGETWRVEAQGRRRVTLWHTIKSRLFGKKG